MATNFKKYIWIGIIGLFIGFLISQGIGSLHNFIKLQQIKKHITKSPDIKLFFEADKLEQKGQYLQAIENYKKALALRPNDPMFLESLGETYMKVGKYKEAIKTFKKTNPDKDTMILIDMAEAYWHLGKIKKTFKLLNKAEMLGDPLAKIEKERYQKQLKNISH